MRLLSKLSLQLFVSSVILISLHIFFIRWWQVEQLEHVAARELRLLGESVQTSFESAIRHHDSHEMGEQLEHLERISPQMDFVLFGDGGELILHSEGSSRADARFADLLADPQRDQDDGIIRFYHSASTKNASALMLLRVLVPGEEIHGYLGISMPLRELEDEIGLVNQAGVWLLLALLIFNIFAGILLGRIYLISPLDELAGALERIGQGDLSGKLEVRRKDEIGRLLVLVNDLSVELDRSRADLRAQMEERQLLLTALRHRDRLASVGQMAAGVAHEIGSPLQVLLGRARSLSRQTHDPKKVEHIAQIISAQIERIGRIVERMLSFARPHDSVLVSARPEPIVRQVIELLSPEIQRAQQRLDYHVSEDAADAQCPLDTDGLQQIVFNLLMNASNWTPPNERIEISCTLEVWPTPNPPAPRAFCLSVKDHGKGMSEETLERVFELFFTLRAGDGGSGLGLPIVKTIVQQHHGHLEITSTPSEGSRVQIWLPLNS